MARLNATDKLEALRKKQKEIEAQIKAGEARERENARKLDTRRKIVAGAVVLEHVERNPKSQFAKEFRELIKRGVEARNQPLFGLHPANLPAEDGVSGKTDHAAAETAAE